MQGKRASLFWLWLAIVLHLDPSSHRAKVSLRKKSPNVVLLVVELVEERCGVKSESGGTRQVVGGDPHHLCTLSLRP